ncbi:MAG: transposase, partial [Arenicella sp.]
MLEFEQRSKDQLAKAKVAHADETGININGKRHWL